MAVNRKEVLLKLFNIEAVKFGTFKLKSGIESPVYFDLRVIISYPQLMAQVSELLWEVASTHCGSDYQLICGVPYTALPLATCVSVSHNIAMVMRRKEAKDYGTKRLIEGRWNNGDICLIIEDVVTTGSSVLETAQSLRAEGLTVHDAIVLLDREQGGKNHLSNSNIALHSVFSMAELLDVLLASQKIDRTMFDKVKTFLSDNSNVSLPQYAAAAASSATAADPKAQAAASALTAFASANSAKENADKAAEFAEKAFAALATAEAASKAAQENAFKAAEKAVKVTAAPDDKILSYEARAELCSHHMSRRLFNIMSQKKTNLAFSADCASITQLLQLAQVVGPYICMLKTHVDIIKDFSLESMLELRRIADEHNFIIFEDRKFADIGNTVKEQYRGGVYAISSWADVINAHTLPGPGILDALKMVDSSKACILIAQMSSEGNLLDQRYTKATLAMADRYDDYVIGFISTTRVSNNPRHIHFTPGVRMDLTKGSIGSEGVKGDGLGQQYVTPSIAIGQNGSDVIIVGRGILTDKDPAKAAEVYRDAGYAAYLSLL